MTISFERKTDFIDRRRQGRAPLGIEVFIRERSRSAASARLTDLSSFGCCVEDMVLVHRDAQVWIRLPGLESLSVRLVWSDGARFGFEFDTPLHPAVASRFMPSAGSHAAASINRRSDHDPLLSRREQIMSGIAGSDLSPLQRKKKPSGLGIMGRINRVVARQVDHRAERRYGDAVPENTALSIGDLPMRVINVSPSGMKVRGDLGEREIGEELPVAFDGFEPMTGQLVWMNGTEAGIALPPHSIELFDRAG
ncbi:MAG: hypothetical protein GXC70_01365 [Sphingomonadaceae bacterium]|nr:hypothetical protein [Sphingomonadaceae bacterium]